MHALLKPFPLLQYDWMWLNKTFIQVKLFFICGIVCSIPFWYHLCWCPPLKWWWWWWISWWLVLVGDAEGNTKGDTSQTGRSCCFSQTGCPSGRISYHSGGSWMVFHQCESFHALSGCPSGWVSCHSWIVISRAFIKWQNWMTSQLDSTFQTECVI